jgi:hypothetical protein
MRAARFDSMVRNFFEMLLRARRALEFSHSQDPERTSLNSPGAPPVLREISQEVCRSGRHAIENTRLLNELRENPCASG